MTLNQNKLLQFRRIICIMALSLITSAGSAQSDLVSFSYTDTCLQAVLKEIALKTGYSFHCDGKIGLLRINGTGEVMNMNIREAVATIIKKVEETEGVRLHHTITKSAIIVKYYQEDQEVKGRILNEKNEPLPKASIQISGTDSAVFADQNGYFSLKIRDRSNNDTLIVSHLNYNPLRYPKRNFPNIIVLQLKVPPMEEVAVKPALGVIMPKKYNPNPGFTTHSYDTDSLNIPPSNLQELFRGVVPGIDLVRQTGIPGAAFSVYVRGNTTLDGTVAGRDPIIVIDGFKLEPGMGPTNMLHSPANGGSNGNGGISSAICINPGDIDYFNLLKGAAATSIYGAYGSNGVLEISTRKGVRGKAVYEISLISGVSQISDFMAFAPLALYLDTRENAFIHDTILKTLQNARDLLEWKNYRQQDIPKMLTGRMAPYTRMFMNCSGGLPSFQYFFSFGLDDERSIFGRGLADTRGTFRANLRQVSKNGQIECLFNTYLSRYEMHSTQYDLTKFILFPPNFPVYDNAGELYFTPFNGYTNPEAMALRRYNIINDYGSANLRVNVNFLKTLSLRTVMAISQLVTMENATNPGRSNFPGLVLKGRAAFSDAKVNAGSLQGLLTWAPRYQTPEVKVVAGAVYQQRETQTQASFGEKYPNDDGLEDIRNADSVFNNGPISSQYKYAAAFGSGTIVYDKKLILQATLRGDISSRMGPGKKFGLFPSASLAWILSEEKWMKPVCGSGKDSTGRKRILSFLKFFLAGGQTGNDRPGDRLYEGSWTEDISLSGIITYRPVIPRNPNFSWEKKYEIEAALEAAFFESCLTLNAGVYYNITTDFLLRKRLLDQTGYKSMISNTDVEVMNKGIELAIGFREKPGKKIWWSWSVNLTLQDNRIIKLPEEVKEEYRNEFEEGKPIRTFMAYRWEGVDPVNGRGKFVDENGDGKITAEGDALIRGSFEPDMFGATKFELAWDRWSFVTEFYFRVQDGRNFRAFIGATPPGSPFNQPLALSDQWQKNGDKTPYMRATTRQSGEIADDWRRYAQSTEAFGDASFIRCQSVALAYTFDWKKKGGTGKYGLRIFVNAKNLFTITGYEGHDPETQDLFILPTLRTLEAGIGLRI